MRYTDKFRTQHEDILSVVGDITRALKANEDAQVLRKLLSSLAGKLSFHLAMEDEALYPRLMGAGQAQTKELATRFKNEMGGLGGNFNAYNSKWQLSAIRADMAGFAKESHAIFNSLGKRIARENAELYPLADSATA